MEKIDFEKPVSMTRAADITMTTIRKLEASGTPQALAMRQLAVVLLALVQSQARMERDMEMATKRLAVLVNDARIEAEYANPDPS